MNSAVLLRSPFCKPLIVAFFWCLSSLPAAAGVYQAAIEQLGYTELVAALGEQALEDDEWSEAGERLEPGEAQALAVLRLLGAPTQPERLDAFVRHALSQDGAYLGRLGEPSLATRLASVWALAGSAPQTRFTRDLRALIAGGIANGYNIDTTPWPQFEPERHLVYGHNDIGHAQQLLVLMAGAGLQAKVGVSLKTSAFLHRDDWGPASPDAHALGEGRYLNEVREFDLHFEFDSHSGKADFMQLINRYAKQDREQQPGLIRSAWWQPYYRSLIPEPGFREAAQVRITGAGQTAVVLTLPEQAEALSGEVRTLSKPWELASTTVWVNPAFYRYLQGGYK